MRGWKSRLFRVPAGGGDTLDRKHTLNEDADKQRNFCYLKETSIQEIQSRIAIG